MSSPLHTLHSSPLDTPRQHARVSTRRRSKPPTAPRTTKSLRPRSSSAHPDAHHPRPACPRSPRRSRLCARLLISPKIRVGVGTPRICSHGPDIFHVQRRKCTGGMRWCAALAVLALTGSSFTVDAHPGCIHSQKAIRSKPLIIRCAPDSLHVCVSIFQLDRPNAAPSRALFGLCAPTELRRRTSRHFQTGGQQVISSPFASGSTFR